MVKKLIIAGNWKSYVADEDQAKKIAGPLKRKANILPGIDIVLFPPAPLLPIVATAVSKSTIATGAQAISPLGQGAYTGYVSAEAVKNAGATWALVGHLERRAPTINGVQAAGESEDTIAAEVAAAHTAGLRVMLCIGELERDPHGSHFAIIARQLSSALARLSLQAGFPKKLVIAYEPVWAIGKSAAEACKPADLEEMSIFIRRTLSELFDRAAATKIPILYGGSVDATNAKELLMQGGVSGFLVGRASTEAKSFVELLDACTN